MGEKSIKRSHFGRMQQEILIRTTQTYSQVKQTARAYLGNKSGHCYTVKDVTESGRAMSIIYYKQRKKLNSTLFIIT